MNPFEINSALSTIQLGSMKPVRKFATLFAFWEDNRDSFDAINYARLLTIAERLGVKKTQVGASLCPLIIKFIPVSDPRCLSSFIKDYAKLRYFDLDLVDAVAKEVISRIHEFAPQQLTNIIWAYATLGFYNQSLLNAIETEVNARINQLTPNQICTIIWAFAVLGHSPAKVKEWLSRILPPYSPNRTELQQIYHAAEALKFSLPPVLARQISERLVPSINSAVGQHEDSVATLLASLGLRFQRQAVVDYFQLDFLVTAKEGQINIELDGSYHYLKNTDPPRLTGGDTLRDRLLTRRGIQVVRVPLHAWLACRCDQQRCELILRCCKGKIPEQ